MKILLALSACVALCAAMILPTSGQKSGVKNKMEAAFVPGEVLVQFKAGAGEFEIERAAGKINGSALEKVRKHSYVDYEKGDLVLVRFQPDFSMREVQNVIKEDSSVEFVEPNYIYTLQAAPSDPYYTNGSLWGMYGDAATGSSQYGSQAKEAWAAGHVGSAEVYVGIIDQGIQFDHTDLSGQVWTNPFDPVDGLDNDGNGYVDDTHGWDFEGNNNTIYDGGRRGTLDNHGTHVSGTIGAKANRKGVVGINWNVTLISGKIFGSAGATTANAIKAVDYFTDLKTRHRINIVATNNSWGGGGFSQGLEDAISRANAADILFVAAAGNNGTNNDTADFFPSTYNLPNIIAVAAITSSGEIASFSQYGATTVDIAAPGSGIWSTTAGNNYSSYSGTSMATPHVTGGVALYASTHPGATAAEIKAAILSSAVPTASLSGKCVTGGRLNISGF